MKKLIVLLAACAMLLAAVALRPRTTVAQTGAPPPLISEVAVTPFGDQSTQSLTSAEQRVYLSATQTASVAVQLSPGGGVVLLRAPEGGLINGQRKVEIDTDQVGRNIVFSFDPGADIGLFVIEISDDRTSETLAEFWVGPDLPRGQAGPSLTFN